MKFNILFSRLLLAMFILAITSNAQSNFYEGDPVLILSGYDFQTTNFGNSGDYGSDPVMQVSGLYDTPARLTQGSDYNYADSKETDSNDLLSQDEIEFSAFEHESVEPVIIQLETSGQPKNNASDINEHSWSPDEWYETY